MSETIQLVFITVFFKVCVNDNFYMLELLRIIYLH